MVEIFFVLVTIDRKTWILRFCFRFFAERTRMEVTGPVSHNEQSQTDLHLPTLSSFTKCPISRVADSFRKLLTTYQV